MEFRPATRSTNALVYLVSTDQYLHLYYIHTSVFSAGGLAAPLGVAAAATIGGAVGEAFLRMVLRLRWEKGLRMVFMISLNFLDRYQGEGSGKYKESWFLNVFE